MGTENSFEGWDKGITALPFVTFAIPTYNSGKSWKGYSNPLLCRTIREIGMRY